MNDTQQYFAIMSASGSMTAEVLSRMRLPGKRLELVRGRLFVREPAGFRHGRIVAKLAYRLTEYVTSRNLGYVLAAETGFKLTSEPDTVRAPDIAFVSRKHLPDPEPVGFAEFAPDLAVEVLSPDDRHGEVLAKVADWLTAGSRLVWVVDPERELVRVYGQDGSQSLVSGSASLSGEDVIPGFSCAVESIL